MRHEMLGIGRHIMQVSAWLRLVQSQFIAIVNLAVFWAGSNIKSELHLIDAQSYMTTRKAAMDAHDPSDHGEQPQTKRRKLNRVNSDRCRFDKQNMKIYLFRTKESSTADLVASVPLLIEPGQQDAIVACKRVFPAQKAEDSSARASIRGSRYRCLMDPEEAVSKKIPRKL
jgi:hypothetical protein